MVVLPWATILYNLEYLHWLIEDILGRHQKSPMVLVRFLHVVEGQVEIGWRLWHRYKYVHCRRCEQTVLQNFRKNPLRCIECLRMGWWVLSPKNIWILYRMAWNALADVFDQSESLRTRYCAGTLLVCFQLRRSQYSNSPISAGSVKPAHIQGSLYQWAKWCIRCFDCVS